MLLGSLHAGLARFYPLPDAVEAAFAQATRLYVELDADEQADAIRAAAHQAALLPGGATLDEVLSPATRHALHRAYHGRPWELRALQRLQPWALALLLPNADDVRLGADPRWGVDAHLVSRARARGLPVVALEPVGAQVAAFAAGPLAEQDAALALRLAQRSRWDRGFVRIVDAWRRGDLDALAALKDHAYPREGPLAALRERLFLQRDRLIARRLAAALEDPHPAMALVGALHLAGPDALPLLLRGHGVDVRRIAGG